MRCCRLNVWTMLVLCAFAAAGQLWAHQVPSMTMEADFATNRGFSVKINFDPRLFLSEQPTSLPPVPGSWYREQTEAERAKTHADALAYLKKNVELVFGSETMPLPAMKLEAIDGATNEPFTDATEEVHLLASGRSVIPGSAQEFSVRLGRGANVSLILLNRVEGQKEAVPRVVFANETSQAFPLTGVRSLDEMVGSYSGSSGSGAKGDATSPWMMRGVLVLALLVIWLLFLRKRAAPAVLAERRRRRR